MDAAARESGYRPGFDSMGVDEFMSDRPTIASLKARAVALTGLSDFGDDSFEAPLAAWVEDLAGPSLRDSGRAFLTRLAVTNLCRRLEVLDCLARHPEIGDVAIPPILYITGLERSGTTLLHNLLALHPRSRALLRWELMRPTPPPETASFRSDPRIAEVQASIEPLRGTRLEQMHWVDADDPEECVWGAYDCTGLLGRANGALMPTWSRLVRESDRTQTLRAHRRLIQLLTWRHPVPSGGHLALKCPQNSRHLVELARVFPEARFVFTHRDPHRTTVSVCALVDHINAPFSLDEDLLRPGGPAILDLIESVELGLRCMLEFARTDPERVAHVAYPALVHEPASIVREIHERFEVTEPRDLAAPIEDFMRAQAAGKRATPPAELPDYGIESGEFRARPVVAEYCARFGVEAETSRITGVRATAR